MKKPDLTMAQLNSLLEEARKSSFFDYIAILTVVALNLRGASIVGQTDARMSPNPGLLIENLTPEGIRVFEKHGPKEGNIKQIPPVLRNYIEQIIGKRTSGRIFPRTRAWLWWRVQSYGIKAGLPKGYVKPNTLSDFSEYHDAHLLEILNLESPRRLGFLRRGRSKSIKRIEQAPEPVAKERIAKDVRIVGEKINYPGLTYAPTNEQGVVHLFGIMCEKLGFSVEQIHQAFPDAVAIDYRESKTRGTSKNIEFEFKSSRFSRQKGHVPERCDIIVCWEHDWKNCPKEIEVIELKRKVKDLT